MRLRPISLYAKAKVEIEKFLKNNKKKLNYSFNILRFATAYGTSPRMRFDLTINQFVNEIYFDKEVGVYDPDTWRPYCHIKDFAGAIHKVILKSENIKYQVFNIGSNNNNYSKNSDYKTYYKADEKRKL